MLKENIYNIFTIMIMLIFVIFLSYYITMIIGKKSSFYFRGRATKILERSIISTNLSIIIIQVIDKVYILAVQNKNLEVIDVLDAKKWQEYTNTQEQPQKASLLSLIKAPYDKIEIRRKKYKQKE